MAASAWRRVERTADLAAAFARRRAGLSRRSATRRVYLERYLERPRHVEIQVSPTPTGPSCTCTSASARSSGATRSWSRSRRRPASTPALKRGLTEAAIAGARAIGYVNAGTMEFLVDAAGASTSWR